MIYNFRYHSQHREDRTVRREAKTWEIIIIIWDSFLLMSLIIKMKNITQMLLLFLLFVSLSFCYKNSLRFPSASRNETFCLRSSSVCWVQAPFRSCVFQMILNKQKMTIRVGLRLSLGAFEGKRINSKHFNCFGEMITINGLKFGLISKSRKVFIKAKLNY